MTHKKSLALFGSVCLILALVALPLMTACPSEPTEPTQEEERPTQAEPAFLITLKLASELPETTSPGQFAKWWAEEVTKRTNGQVQFEYFWAASLIKPGEGLDAVANGIIDVYNLDIDYYPDKLRLVNLSSCLPFGPTDMEMQRLLWNKMFENPAMVNDIEQYNQKLLGIGAVSEFAIGAKEPVLTLDDFKGRKIACTGAYMPVWLDVIGGVPVTLPAVERYMALKTSVVDSGVIGFEAHLTFKYYEIANQITRLGICNKLPGGVTVNQDVWNQLPSDIQKIMEETGDDAERQNVIYNNHVCYLAARAIQKAGGAVYDLPYEERVKWAEAMPNLGGDWAKKMDALGLPGTELVKLYIDTCSELGHPLTRECELE